MKASVTITVDVDVLMWAKGNIHNLSGFVNDTLMKMREAHSGRGMAASMEGSPNRPERLGTTQAGLDVDRLDRRQLRERIALVEALLATRRTLRGARPLRQELQQLRVEEARRSGRGLLVLK